MTQTVVITGASAGIGRATARLYGERGANVALFDVNTAQGGAGAVFFKTDVGSEESVASSMDAVIDRFGRLDILVNCAAVQIMGTLLETTSEQWDRLHQVNLKGVFLCSKSAMPHLQASGAGAIVNISSMAAHRGADVTGIDGVKTGDVATLYGADGAASQWVSEVAATLGTVSSDLLCAIGKRVPRFYVA